MPNTTRTLLLVAVLSGCAGDRTECRFDIECPMLERCVSGSCEPVRQTPRPDAAVGLDAAVGRDAAVDRDSAVGQDSGTDASAPETCELALVTDVSVDMGAGTDDSPALVRSGVDLFGVLYRGQGDTVMARFLDSDGQAVGGASTLSEGGSPNIDLALTANGAGMLLGAWVDQSDARIHGATINGEGSTLIDLTEAAPGTFYPALAWNGDGFVLAWTDRSVDDQEQIWTRALDATGQPQGEPVRHETPGRARMPALATGDGAETPIVWQDMRSGTAVLYAGLRAADGSIEELAVSEAQLARSAAIVQTPFGAFASWVEPGADGGKAALHVTRGEGEVLTDHVIERAMDLDPRTSIAWDDRMLLVGWQTGMGAAALARVDAVAVDFESQSTLEIGLGTAAPRVAADDDYRGLVWVEADTGEVRFGALDCVVQPEE